MGLAGDGAVPPGAGDGAPVASAIAASRGACNEAGGCFLFGLLLFFPIMADRYQKVDVVKELYSVLLLERLLIAII